MNDAPHHFATLNTAKNRVVKAAIRIDNSTRNGAWLPSYSAMVELVRAVAAYKKLRRTAP